MSSYQMSLVLVQVQISSESSNRCSEQGGEIELRDTVSHSSLALGELPFQVVFVIRALSTYTSEISLPGWKEEIHNSSKRRGEPKGVLPREAAFLYCLLPQLLLKFPLDHLVSFTV